MLGEITKDTEVLTIIFLDIDGVMVSGRSRIDPVRSRKKRWKTHDERYVWDPCAAGIVRRLLEDFQPSAYVINSTWNLDPDKIKHYAHLAELMNYKYTENLKFLLEDLTGFPRLPKTETGIPRVEAIEEWIQRVPPSGVKVNWVAFDDAFHEPLEFAAPRRFVNVDPYDGITYANYLQATEILGKLDTSRIVF